MYSNINNTNQLQKSSKKYSESQLARLTNANPSVSAVTAEMLTTTTMSNPNSATTNTTFMSNGLGNKSELPGNINNYNSEHYVAYDLPFKGFQWSIYYVNHTLL